MITCGDPVDPGIWYAGGNIPPISLRGTHVTAYNRASHHVSFASGCSLLAIREVIERTDWPNNAFFAYCEDIEWSIRAGRAGLHIACVSVVRPYHLVSVSVRLTSKGGNQHFSFYYRFFMRNWCHVIRLHARGLQTLAAPFVITLSALYRSFGFLSKSRVDKLHAHWNGVKEECATPNKQLAVGDA